MKNQTSGCPRAAADRFARFQERPDVKCITAKYADYVATPKGVTLSIQLACEAISFLSGIMTRRGHEVAVEELADKYGIPIADLRILAECPVEVLRLAGRPCSSLPGS
jgi:hypothetical protein